MIEGHKITEQDYQFPPTDFSYTESDTVRVNFPQAPRGLTEQTLAEAEAQASCGEQHKSFSLQEIKKQGNKHQHLHKPQTGSDGKLP